MELGLSILSGVLSRRQAVDEVMSCNGWTSQFGLALTERQAMELVQTRAAALRGTGRIELGSGVIEKIIRAFGPSPHLHRHNYEEVLHELLDIFYAYQNETEDRVSDDELIALMKDAFDGQCQGSLELLAGRELERLARGLRGQGLNWDEEVEEDGDEAD